MRVGACQLAGLRRRRATLKLCESMPSGLAHSAALRSEGMTGSVPESEALATAVGMVRGDGSRPTWIPNWRRSKLAVSAACASLSSLVEKTSEGVVGPDLFDLMRLFQAK